MTTRLIVAIPGVIAVLLAVALGGPLFIGLALIISLIGLFEFYRVADPYRPLRWAGYVGVAATVVFAGTVSPPERAMVLGLGATLGCLALAAVLVPGGKHLVSRLGVTALGVLYLGAPLAVLVLLRRLEVGDAAVINVLVGTWVFDTASYFGGKLWGRRPIAPNISPHKTVEGFVVGFVVGVLAVWVAGLYMDWIGHLESVVLGAAICGAAYLGDLFESRLKRDAHVKDSGTLLLGHGGVLDRFDALLFSVIPGYLITVWLVL
ncbi:MAG: phosphatidate cytidylyltransferase [Thermoleophilia bacterium]|nr:phosphatidate cytidylyltransferase [Thermoleophilia bacterium]MDH3724130.1 phosphatidate cytidylyltransferase [Thermoleophilia bacterium]